jgi:hypothetical protein
VVVRGTLEGESYLKPRNLAKKEANAAETVDRKHAAQVAAKIATFVTESSSNKRVAIAAAIAAKVCTYSAVKGPAEADQQAA